MLIAKIFCIVLIFLGIHINEDMFGKSQVAAQSDYAITQMVVLIDPSEGLRSSDRNSIGELVKGLIHNYRSHQYILDVCFMLIDYINTSLGCGWFGGEKQVASYLGGVFRNSATHRRNNRYYATAFSQSIELLKSHVNQSAVLLITHRSEACTVNECLDANHCCNYSCLICYNRKNVNLKCKMQFVTDQADKLKEAGVKVITVGIGDGTNPARLKCWATNSHMSIQLASYSELQQKRTQDIILNLLLGNKFLTKPHTIRTIAKTVSSVTTKGATAPVVVTVTTKGAIAPVIVTPATKSAIAPVTATVANKGTTVPVIRTSVTISANSKPTTTESATITAAHAKKGNTGSGQLKWHWWFLIVSAIIIVILIIMVLIIGIIVWRKKRRRLVVVPVAGSNGDGSSRRYPHKSFDNATFNAVISSTCTALSSSVVKDPYLVVDQSSCALHTKGSGHSGFFNARSKQLDLTKSKTAAGSKASGNEWSATGYDITTLSFDGTLKPGSLTRFKKGITFPVAKTAPSFSKVKRRDSASSKNFKRSNPRNVGKLSEPKCEKLKSTTSSKSLPMSPPAHAKPIVSPTAPPQDHFATFRTLEF